MKRMKGNSKKSRLAFILLLTSVVSVSCKKAPPLQESVACSLPELQLEQEDGKNTVQLRECVIPEQDPNANLDINPVFRDFEKFPLDRKNKMLEAIEKLKVVVNSVQFKERVRDHIFNGRYTFSDNNGLSNEQIYDQIMDGAETLSNAIDNEMDLDITLYYKNNSTVGYTYPNTRRVWVNEKFLRINSLGKVAANVIHEWTHKVGFGHDFNRTVRRNYSVPYGVGKIVAELVDNM